MGGAGRSCLFSPREKIEMRGPLATTTGYRSPPPSRSVTPVTQRSPLREHLKPLSPWERLREAPARHAPLDNPQPLPYHQERTYVPWPAARGRAERGPQTTHTQRRTQPQPTTDAPFLGAALSVDTATVAASPSRPVLPTDHKPGGSSRLSPATRRRPASVTATDGKAPAPLLAARGTNPRLARGVREPPASLHPAWWTGPSAPS